MEKSVGIIGASGLIGTALSNTFQQLGWNVVRISRTPKTVLGETWKPLEKESLRGLDTLINLAGESVSKRWTDANKKLFHSSRVDLATQLAQWLCSLPDTERPTRWLNASAIGIYGNRYDEALPETAAHGSGYLADLCIQWELAAHTPAVPNCRIIHPRIGVVLGKDAPAWDKMRLPFSLGLGGRLGSGQQWFPWVHLQDVVDSLVFLTELPNAEGPYNIVAPESVRNSTFTKALGAALKRPTLFPAPAFALKLLLGEFASALLASQKVIPAALTDAGFRWSHPDLTSALDDLTHP